MSTSGLIASCPQWTTFSSAAARHCQCTLICPPRVGYAHSASLYFVWLVLIGLSIYAELLNYMLGNQIERVHRQKHFGAYLFWSFFFNVLPCVAVAADIYVLMWHCSWIAIFSTEYPHCSKADVYVLVWHC